MRSDSCDGIGAVCGPKVELLPSFGRSGGLEHQTIEHIIRQKEEYFAYKREQDSNIWKDPDFHPGPLLDKISDRIAMGLVKEAATLLEDTCDEFIDCLVHSEFFPDE
jgi:hypothetical protein